MNIITAWLLYSPVQGCVACSFHLVNVSASVNQLQDLCSSSPLDGCGSKLLKLHFDTHFGSGGARAGMNENMHVLYMLTLSKLGFIS
jgi:hypothetical protein